MFFLSFCSLTLNTASAGIYACTVLYCTVLYCIVLYCSVIDFSSNTMWKFMWKKRSILILEGTGAYGPLLLSPPEGIYNIIKYITVQYSTVTGEEDGVWRWITPYSTLCGVSVTGAASLVAECAINILLKKMPKITFLKPLFGELP